MLFKDYPWCVSSRSYQESWTSWLTTYGSSSTCRELPYQRSRVIVGTKWSFIKGPCALLSKLIKTRLVMSSKRIF